MDKCIYKYGLDPVGIDEFKTASCKQCLNYLQMENENNSFPLQSYMLQNGDGFIRICDKYFAEEDCARLWNCCADAIECCRRQTKLKVDADAYCPMVWDGFLCWNQTRLNDVTTQKCPSFLHFESSGFAVKKCLENATWALGENGLGWTNYSQCTELDKNVIPLWIELAFLLASIIITIPAIFLLILKREQRNIVRIRLHVLLLSMLTARNVLLSLFDLLHIIQFRGVDTEAELISPTLCLILRIFLLYAQSACFYCFLMEGLYLFRLINNSLKKPKYVLPMVLLFLGIPCLFVGAYSLIRFQLYTGEDSCWIGTVSKLEWLFNLPNLICVAANVGLLVYVMRVLMKRFCSRERDVINIKRTTKAIIVLIPLFGIQILCTIYRIDTSYMYTILSSVIYDTQAIWASINLSYMNKEIRKHMRIQRRRLKNSFHCSVKASKSGFTSFSHRTRSTFVRKFNLTFRILDRHQDNSVEM